MHDNLHQACECCISGLISIPDLLLGHSLAQSALAICLPVSYMLCTQTSWSHVQTLHDERFLLVVKSTPPQHGETATAGIAAVPVMSETTLVLVSNHSHGRAPCRPILLPVVITMHMLLDHLFLCYVIHYLT